QIFQSRQDITAKADSLRGETFSPVVQNQAVQVVNEVLAPSAANDDVTLLAAEAIANGSRPQDVQRYVEDLGKVVGKLNPAWVIRRHFAGPGAETASETAAMTTPATEVPGLSTTAPVGDTTAPATSVVGDSPVSLVDSAPAANTTGPGTVTVEDTTAPSPVDSGADSARATGRDGDSPAFDNADVTVGHERGGQTGDRSEQAVATQPDTTEVTEQDAAARAAEQRRDRLATSAPEPVLRQSIPLSEFRQILPTLERTKIRLADGRVFDLPWRFVENYCWLRAHIVAHRLRTLGVEPRKIFVSRDGLRGRSEFAFGGRRGHPATFTIGYHIATVVNVTPDDGGPAFDVVVDFMPRYLVKEDGTPAVDPSTEFLTPREWLTAMGVPDGYTDADLQTKPHLGWPDAGLRPGETRVRVTTDAVVAPPWLPAELFITFEEADRDMVANVAAAPCWDAQRQDRQGFRAWDDGLRPGARERCDALYEQLTVTQRFHLEDWFNHMRERDRAYFEDRLEHVASRPEDLQPGLFQHIGMAMANRHRIPAEALSAAWRMVNDLLGGDTRSLGNLDDLVTTVAYRWVRDGMFHTLFRGGTWGEMGRASARKFAVAAIQLLRQQAATTRGDRSVDAGGVETTAVAQLPPETSTPAPDVSARVAQLKNDAQTAAEELSTLSEEQRRHVLRIATEALRPTHEFIQLLAPVGQPESATADRGTAISDLLIPALQVLRNEARMALAQPQTDPTVVPENVADKAREYHQLAKDWARQHGLTEVTAPETDVVKLRSSLTAHVAFL